MRSYPESEERPVFKVISNLDYFRGEGGSPKRPYVFDDGVMPDVHMGAYTAFFDISAEDAKVWAGWGATSFGKHQYRPCVSNNWVRLIESEMIDHRTM
eukprot:4567806-Amphidinium_carterae.1